MDHEFHASKIQSIYNGLEHPPKKTWGKKRTATQLRNARPDRMVFAPLGFEILAREPYASYDEFESEIQRIGQVVAPEMMDSWNFKKVIYHEPRIRLRMRVKTPSGERFSRIVELLSDNGSWFTAGELFFKAHRLSVETFEGQNGQVSGHLDRHFHTDHEPQMYNMNN